MIDREKVLNDLQELCEYLFHEYKVCYKGDEEDTYNRFLAANNALNLLKSQPEQKFFVNSDGKITPLPIQKHGHWIPVKLPSGVEEFGYKEYMVQEVTCSKCRFTEDVMASAYSYCPKCGAKMDEEVAQNDRF